MSRGWRGAFRFEIGERIAAIPKLITDHQPGHQIELLIAGLANRDAQVFDMFGQMFRQQQKMAFFAIIATKFKRSTANLDVHLTHQPAPSAL